MHDIETIEDVQLLVNTFYDKIQKNPLLGPVFATRIADGNWQPHLEKMYRFWSTLLLYTQTYNGSPFDKHIGLGIGGDHFQQWLIMFDNTVDELFEGTVANTAKERAHNIGLTFEYKLQSLNTIPIVKASDNS
ncbi:MAG: group III truncated hemoglobin [Bacteroidota bacterium]